MSYLGKDCDSFLSEAQVSFIYRTLWKRRTRRILADAGKYPSEKSLTGGSAFLFICLFVFYGKVPSCADCCERFGKLGLTLILPHLMLLTDPTENSSIWTFWIHVQWHFLVSFSSNSFLLIYLPRTFPNLFINWVQIQHLCLLCNMFWTKKTFPMTSEILWIPLSKFTRLFLPVLLFKQTLAFCCQLEQTSCISHSILRKTNLNTRPVLM